VMTPSSSARTGDDAVKIDANKSNSFYPGNKVIRNRRSSIEQIAVWPRVDFNAFFSFNSKGC